MGGPLAGRPARSAASTGVLEGYSQHKERTKMKKTTITCDCCGTEMIDATGAEMRAQLRDKGIRFEIDGELDMPTTDLDDICDECAIALHRAILEVIAARKMAPSNA